MRLSLFSVLSLLSTLALASPAPVAYPKSTSSLTSNTNFPKFFLQTSLVKADESKSKYCGLYISRYHTGAGLNDAVATSNSSYHDKAYINTTAGNTLEFDLGTPFTWGFVHRIEPYTDWSPVEINAAGAPDKGFRIDKRKGLVWGTEGCNPEESCGQQFGGWLVCDWWHGLPQLFWRTTSSSTEDHTALSSCADVYLRPIYPKK